MAKTILV